MSKQRKIAPLTPRYNLERFATLSPNDIYEARQLCYKIQQGEDVSIHQVRKIAQKLGILPSETITQSNERYLCKVIHEFVGAQQDFEDDIVAHIQELPPELVINEVLPSILSNMNPAYLQQISKTVNRYLKPKQRPTIEESIHCTDMLTPCLLTLISVITITPHDTKQEDNRHYYYQWRWAVRPTTSISLYFQVPLLVMFIDLLPSSNKYHDDLIKQDIKFQRSAIKVIGGNSTADKKQMSSFQNFALQSTNAIINSVLKSVLHDPKTSNSSIVLEIKVPTIDSNKDDWESGYFATIWKYLPQKSPHITQFYEINEFTYKLHHVFQWTAGELRAWFRPS